MYVQENVRLKQWKNYVNVIHHINVTSFVTVYVDEVLFLFSFDRLDHIMLRNTIIPLNSIVVGIFNEL